MNSSLTVITGEGRREAVAAVRTTSPLREPEALSPRLRMRRAVLLLAVTAVLPGTAQVVGGHRRLGRCALAAWLAAVGVVLALAVAFLLHRGVVLALLTRPLVPAAAALACFATALAWPVLVVDAWRLGRVDLLPCRARRKLAAAAVVLVVVTPVPGIAAGRRAWAAADLLHGVFGSDRVSEAVDGRYTVLLLGGDAGRNRLGLRPDSITLASVDAETGRTVLFSLPRNLEDVPFLTGTAAQRARPGGWDCGDECLLNGLYTFGRQNPRLFPGARDPGAEAMKQAVSASLGLTVNYYVLIDLKGFQRLIDAMGGIELEATRRVPIGGGSWPVVGWIEPGRRHLDGYHALWFARSRHGSSDYERMARQRCVMTAMADQLDPRTLLVNFEEIASAGKGVVSTDIPGSRLGTFVELAVRAREQRITSVQFVPPLVTPAYPDYRAIRQRVRSVLDTVSSETGAPAAPGDGRGSRDGAARGGTRPAATRPAATGGRAAGGQAGVTRVSATAPPEVADTREVCRAG